MSLFHLNIVTPNRCFFSDDVSKVIVRGAEGDFAVLKNRAPLITRLKIGKIRIFQDNKERIAAVVDGYISVDKNGTTIVTNAAEWPEEIDIQRAIKAKEKAEEALKRDRGKDVVQAQLALRRALNRIELTKLHNGDD